MLINLKKISLFIKHSYLKWSAFFPPPILNENMVWGVLQIIVFFNYIEFCIRILEDGPLWSSGENTRAFQKLYNYLFSLLLSLQYTHSNWKKEKKNIPGGIHLHICIGQAHTSHSEWLFFFCGRQVALPTIKTQLVCSFRGNTYRKAAAHFNQGSQSSLQAVIAS